jgi:hypothetical protein
MCKVNSGLFSGTKGAGTSPLEKDETTATVWDHIKPTADNYPNTKIPRSFEVDVPKTPATPDGKMWTHGNATKHMHEAMFSLKEDLVLKTSNPNLYAQFILYDYYKSLGRAVSHGVKYSGTMTIGNWEFAFAKPRTDAKYPVVKHALFMGLQN